MSYADFLADRLAVEGRPESDLLLEVARRRGLLVDEARGLHPGSTEDDRRFFARLRSAFASADSGVKATRAALSLEPGGDEGEAMARAFRRNPPFFRVRYSPARPDARLLDPGVAMLVKTLPLVGVWTWCSCDGHHGLGDRPRAAVEPASIWLADDWYAQWFGAILALVRRHISLESEWDVRDKVIYIDGAGAGPGHTAAFAQDSDMVRMGAFLQRRAINERVQAIKSRCRPSKDRAALRRQFEAACEDLANVS